MSERESAQLHPRRRIIKWSSLSILSTFSTALLWRSPRGTIYETEALLDGKEREAKDNARQIGAVVMNRDQEEYLPNTPERQQAVMDLFVARAELFSTRKTIEQKEGHFYPIRVVCKNLSPILTYVCLAMIGYNAGGPKFEDILTNKAR